MASIQIVGNLGNDVVLKQVNGSTVAEFTIAEKKKRGGQETTIWFKCSMWKGTQSNLMDYLKKGAQFVVIGELDGQGVSDKGNMYNNVTVYDVRFTNGSTPNRNQNQQNAPQGSQNYQQGNQQGYQQNAPQQQRQAPPRNTIDLEDDVPF